jgi:REP-associated tyrosine transposase
MMEDPGEYGWSSYQINALGKESSMCTPHLEYLRLGGTKDDHIKNYHTLFTLHVEGDLLKEIRSGVNKEMAIGHDRFKDKIKI